MRAATALWCIGLGAAFGTAGIADAAGSAAGIDEGRPEAAAASPHGLRFIVKLRPADRARPEEAGNETRSGHPAAARIRAIAQRRGARLHSARALTADLAVLELEDSGSVAGIHETIRALTSDDEVEFIEPDRRRFAHAMPNDPLYESQWHLQGTELAAVDAEAAWDITTGAPDTVIAVLDTGVRFNHPDLLRAAEGGRLLPGYDFVSGEHGASTFVSANDGNGWDPDPSDPGDWVTEAEAASGPLQGCEVRNSSWHGLRVLGLLGAQTDNTVGIAGGVWQARVLPVRVLGKCGGYDSDIVAAMRWAAGLPVSGVPTNPTPAQIINLSLGSDNSCSQTYRNAIAQLTAAGVLVVASAGNLYGPVHTPANCPGVLAVAGVRHLGTKVGYSNFGPQVAVAAPAGNCGDDGGASCLYSLVTTTNTGVRIPGASVYTGPSRPNLGTSFATPIVAAIAGLMHGVNDQLLPADYIARIQAGARAFPLPEPGLPTCPNLHSVTRQCNCTTTTCGAGIADAAGAVGEALRPIARIADPGNVGNGTNVTLDGTGSAAARGRSIASYAWSGTNAGSTAALIGGTTASTTSVAVPPSGQITVRLTVTDDLGRTDSTTLNLGTTAATSGGSSSGGGGGGSIAPGLLALLAFLGLVRRISGSLPPATGTGARSGRCASTAPRACRTR